MTDSPKVIMDGLDEFRQEGREEGERIGERKGREEGRVEGRVEGRAKQLLKQLTARFGRVPAEAKARVLAAKEPALQRWAIRVLTAPSLQAVLSARTTRAKKPVPARRAKRA